MDTVCLSRPYPFRFFKGCLPQILLGPFLNTFSQRLPTIHLLTFLPFTPEVYLGPCQTLLIEHFAKIVNG